jgi:hypothetical protein
MELKIPKYEGGKLGDNQRNIEILKVKISGVSSN